jgi:DNA-binding response OmpR family regulator
LKPARVLMVDDDAEFCDMVATYLREEGFETKVVHRGEHALQILKSEDYDVMILDIMMPGITGQEVLRRIQATESRLAPIPVLMLTARGDDVDRIVGLETGADDYLAKPCNLRELAARLRAILRRSRLSSNDQRPKPPIIVVADVRMDCSCRQVTQSGNTLHLTGAEFTVLRELMESAGHPVSKEALTRAALGRPFVPYDRSIDVHITNLRKKLRPVEGVGSLIKTVRGAGYQFIAPPDR